MISVGSHLTSSAVLRFYGTQKSMDKIFILSMLFKYLSIRTLIYTYHFYVHQSVPSLQNLYIHISAPCIPIHSTATEPLHTHFISMYTNPSHRYRTFTYTFPLHVYQSVPSLQNLYIHISSPYVPSRPIATEPLKYTFHLHVHQSAPSLQNLFIHISSPCASIRPIATEPLHTHFISMYTNPPHHYRTFLYIQNRCGIFPSPSTDSTNFHSAGSKLGK